MSKKKKQQRKEEIIYTAMKLKDLEANVCYCQTVCKPSKRKACDEVDSCLVQLCNSDRKSIAKIGIRKELMADEEGWEEQQKQISDAVKKWRKRTYKMCRQIRVTFEEV